MAEKYEVLDAAVALALQLGTVPSLAQVAHAVGLTKQGVLHHFPSRAVLDPGPHPRRSCSMTSSPT